MKTSITILALLSSIVAGAQTTDPGSQTTTGQSDLPAPTAFSAIARDANSSIWERTVYETGPDGTVIGRKHRYTELGTSLNVKDPQTGLWQPSREQIDLLPPGGAFAAAATSSDHHALFPLDIAAGVVQLTTPDGKQLVSRPVALFLEDDGNSLIIAVLTNSVGELVGSNSVVYPNAFGGMASVRYRYTRAGFEQDIVIQSNNLPDPVACGLIPARTRLGVLTAFFDNNSPVETPGPTDPETGLSDSTLRFGMMTMTKGRAFSVGNAEQIQPAVGATPAAWRNWITNAAQQAAAKGTSTFKRWFQLNGRNFLMEEVPYLKVAAQLEQLPPTTGRLNGISTNLFAGNSFLDAIPARLLSPSTSGEPVNRQTMRLSRVDWDQTPGLVLDYVTVTSAGSYTFKGDQTYLVSAPCYFDNVNLEGGTVIKYATDFIEVDGTLTCQTSSYRPAIFTAIDDNTVGETLPGSTGNPSGNYYANPAIYAPGGVNLSNVRILYAAQGVWVGDSANITLSDSQLIDCGWMAVLGLGDGYSSPMTLTCNNCLYRGSDNGGVVMWDLGNGGDSCYLNNCTIDNIYYLIYSPNSSYYVTGYAVNSIFANVQMSGYSYWGGNNNGFYNCYYSDFGNYPIDTYVNPFQTAGAGSYYLASGSGFQSAGTTGIDPALLADLATKTTCPPIVFSNQTFSVATNFSARTIRDNSGSAVDLGYHYDPLDYCFGRVKATANLTFAAGTAIAWFELPNSYGNGYGISITNGKAVDFSGSLTNPCWFARYSCVQEGGNGLWQDRTYPGGIVNQTVYDPGNPSALQLAFTRLALLANDSCMFRDGASGQPIVVRARNCEFYGSAGGYNILAGYTNCLFYGADFGMGTAAAYPYQRYVNCTFYGGSLYFGHWEGGAPYWYSYIHDCAFDGTTFSMDDPFGSNTNYADYNFNAFNPGAPQPTNEGASTIIATNGFNWQPSWFGNFYLPTNSALVNAGDRTADRVGLAEFTAQTNQSKEGISPVDIGYHYVATDQYGSPASTLASGVPDYISDADGDGLLDSWETTWFGNLTHTGSELDRSGNFLLYDYLHGYDPNAVRTMVVAWGDDQYGESDVPNGLTNAVALAAGGDFGDGFYPQVARGFSVVLRSDGTLFAWGNNEYGQTNVLSPTGVTKISARMHHALALHTNGVVSAWGSWYDYGDNPSVTVPSGLTNVIGIAAGQDHDLALRSDGSVVAWGCDTNAPTVKVPTGLPPVKAIAAGWAASVALLTNGSVVAWGYYSFSETNVPSGLSNVTAIAAGDAHVLALKSDGTVAQWGILTDADVPAGLSNVVAIAAGGFHSFALKNDGSVAIWGDLDLPNFPLDQIIGIGSGEVHNLAIRGGPQTPIIATQPADQTVLLGSNATFSVSAFAPPLTTYQWKFNNADIAGATNATLTLHSVTLNQQGNYRVVISAADGSITSSNAILAVIAPPIITALTQPTNLVLAFLNLVTLNVTVAAPGDQSGVPFSYQWRFNGTNISGATNSDYTFAATNSGTFSLIITHSAFTTNASWMVTVVYPGGVIGWGPNSHGQMNVFPTLTNVMSLAAGKAHGVVALDNGSVTNWGSYWTGTGFVSAIAPPLITNAIAVAAGSRHDLALKKDGSVVAWGLDDFGQTNVPTSATNVIAIAAGGQQSLALLKNQTVMQWGQTNTPIPAGLTNVTAIAAGTNFSVALLQNSTVVAWGANNCGQTNVPPGLSNVVAIAAGGAHALALKVDGTVTAWGAWTNVLPGLSNVMDVAAGESHSLALKNDGTIVAWGDNALGQTNVTAGLNRVKLIAGGGDFSLASQFSPTVMYQVDVSKDLLLIYNSSSSDSSNLCFYYLAHRPMVGGANILGVVCGKGEFTSSTNSDDQIMFPVLNWLTNNPTKRPQYVILFYDIPTRITNLTWPLPYGNYGSVDYHLHIVRSDWQPFVTRINAGSLADCEAYVGKIEFFGTNYLPGTLIISASVRNYGNTNYALDNVRVGSGYPEDFSESGWVVSSATNGLLANGVSSGAIVYYDGVETVTTVITNGVTNYIPNNVDHLTSATNVAGYICWGEHSSLGEQYATNNTVKWTGNSSWWIIETVESFNGQVEQVSPMGNFVQWFASNAFGGTNYANTPVAAVSHVEEPRLGFVENSSIYFGLWSSGRNFGICAWNSRRTPFFQAVGDPFVAR